MIYMYVCVKTKKVQFGTKVFLKSDEGIREQNLTVPRNTAFSPIFVLPFLLWTAHEQNLLLMIFVLISYFIKKFYFI